MRPAPRRAVRAAQPLLGLPLLLLLVVEMGQKTAVKRPAALGAPQLAAALGRADGVSLRRVRHAARRLQQAAAVRCGHLAAPLGGARPEEGGTIRPLLRLEELLLARVRARAQGGGVTSSLVLAVRDGYGACIRCMYWRPSLLLGSSA